MKVIANKDKIKFYFLNSLNGGAINFYKIDFSFSSEWNNLTKIAILVKSGIGVQVPIVNNTMMVPWTEKGEYSIGLVGYTIANGVKEIQISTNLLKITVEEGAGEITTTEQEIPETSVWEQYVATMNTILTQTQSARDTTLQAKTDTLQIKSDVETMKQSVENTKVVIDGVNTEIKTIEGNIKNKETSINSTCEDILNIKDNINDEIEQKINELDVQEEINNKLDEMVEDGTLENSISVYIQPRIDAQNLEIQNFKVDVNNRLQNQDLTIAGLESGSPVFVSSTSDMIDNTKVYVLTTNMHIYYYNGGAFVDSTIQYSAGTSIMSGYNAILNTATQWQNFDNDFNNLIPNKIYFCSQPSSVVLTNAPYSTFNGVVMCVNHREQTNGVVQYAHNPSRGLYIRQCWGTTWYDWKKIATSTDLEPFKNALLGYGSIINTSTAWAQFDNDFDELINNRIYTVQNTTGVTQLHSPTGRNVSGTLLSYNNYSGNRDGQTQLFIPYNANNIYIRLKWGGSWSAWKNIVNDSYINPLLNNRFDELYKVFDIVGVIGDSLASGESAYKDNGTTRYVDLYNKSWGQFMARDSGNTYYNFSKGGLTTRSWFTTEQGYPTASDGNHKCKAYIIGLGVNDQTLGSDYVGTSADININDYTQNADTFYGNYAKIIQTMKEQQPKAKFFLLTVPNSSTSYDNINTAIRYMATIFDNVYVIDLRNNYIDFYQGDVFIRNNLRSGHYNAIAYEYIAKMLEQWISQYIYDNYTEFEQVEFIGTDYEWTE